jgi:hypothetical protein
MVKIYAARATGRDDHRPLASGPTDGAVRRPGTWVVDGIAAHIERQSVAVKPLRMKGTFTP